MKGRDFLGSSYFEVTLKALAGRLGARGAGETPLVENTVRIDSDRCPRSNKWYRVELVRDELLGIGDGVTAVRKRFLVNFWAVGFRVDVPSVFLSNSSSRLSCVGFAVDPGTASDLRLNGRSILVVKLAHRVQENAPKSF